MGDIKRVFFHELGHFIAHEINRKFYQGTGTKSITIYPSADNPELFLGDAKINLSADERERNAPIKERLYEYLASSTYGCIFQAYYLHSELAECFNQNGHDDTEKWNASMRHHGLDDLRPQISAAEKQYYASLRQDGQLDEIMVLDPEKYLIDAGNGSYIVDIDKLAQDTTNFTDNHQPTYAQLLKSYQEIFDKE